MRSVTGRENIAEDPDKSSVDLRGFRQEFARPRHARLLRPVHGAESRAQTNSCGLRVAAAEDGQLSGNAGSAALGDVEGDRDEHRGATGGIHRDGRLPRTAHGELHPHRVTAGSHDRGAIAERQP